MDQIGIMIIFEQNLNAILYICSNHGNMAMFFPKFHYEYELNPIKLYWE